MAVYPGWFRVLDRFVLSPLLHVIQLTARQLHLDEENHCTVRSSLGRKTVTSCTWEGTVLVPVLYGHR